jgi:predicted NAD/FAD-binding protein
MTKNIDVRTSTPVSWVRRMKNNEIYVTDATEKTEKFDKIIFACPSRVIPKLLSSPSYLEVAFLNAHS